ncbi:YfhO family protein [Aerococcus urinaeequi]|uniref:YfhO family protein n=1 Tax=Aerococcus urinaeequi TaxID=51665 RepID=UPI003AAD552A
MKIKKINKQIIFKEFLVVLLLISASILMHFFFINNQWHNNLLMAGPNDQTQQMLVFKDFLYKEFTKGNFFYSFNYSGGGNFLTKLSYYYTTSIFYYMTVLVTWILEKCQIIRTPDIVYWGEISLFLSVIKSSLIAYFASIVISKFKVRRSVSIFAATFYAFAPIYFRHAVLWEFFTDAMLWLPIILLGVECIFEGKKGWLFSLGVALTLFNNGYFAFANLLLSSCYVIMRLFLTLNKDEITWDKKLMKIIIYGILGLGISSVGFMVFVKGFLDNSRSSVDVIAPLWDKENFSIERLLISDPIQVVSFIYLLVIFNFKNYQSKIFQFFSCFTTILIIIRYSPKVASIFNGLSAPQYRWHYITYLFIAITIGIGIEQILKHKSLKSSIFASGLTLLIYYSTLKFMDNSYDINKKYFMVLIGIAMLFYVILSYTKQTRIQYGALMAIFLLTVPFINQFNTRLFEQYSLKTVSKDYLYDTFENPNTNISQAINFIENDANGFYRIEYVGMANLGIAYEQSTFNNYSSFQNKYEQDFIDFFGLTNIKDSSVSIDGLGARQITNSLFQIDYVVAKDNEQYIVPAGYEKVKSFGELSVYKNNYPLAFIHPVKNQYQITNNASFDFKDLQLIDGVYTTSSKNQPLSIDLENDLNFSIEKNNFYHDNYISKSDEGIELVANVDASQNYDELIIDYTLKADTDYYTGNYNYSINGAELQMSSPNDKYALQQFHHQVSIPYNDQIAFDFAGGSGYDFEINHIYGLSYDQLEARSNEDKKLDYNLELAQDKLEINFDNSDGYTYLVLPIFYEDGWQLEINNEKITIENVNNGMIGFKIPKGQLNIKMKFVQPYLYSSIVVSLVSLLILILLDGKKSSKLFKITSQKDNKKEE